MSDWVYVLGLVVVAVLAGLMERDIRRLRVEISDAYEELGDLWQEIGDLAYAYSEWESDGCPGAEDPRLWELIGTLDYVMRDRGADHKGLTL